MKAGFSGCSGIQVHQVEFLIPHNLKDVGVTAQEEVRRFLMDRIPNMALVLAGVAPDVGHPHIQAGPLKPLMLGKFLPDGLPVYVAVNTF